MSFIALELCAITFAFRAIEHARTPQGAVAWVVFLVTAPHLAVPIFLFLGNAKFRGYAVARRDSARVIARIGELSAAHPPRHDPEGQPAQAFSKIAAVPVCGGNGFELLVDGRATFDAIFAAIDAAEHYVLVQFYIIHDDEIGRALQERLLACAARGVSVRLLYDAVGSHGLPKAWLARLAEAGIPAYNAHAKRGPRTRFQINFRNHRKTVVVDGNRGFIGGLNVGDEYLGLHPVLSPWRDTHCRITGPMVKQLQLVFAEDWHFATGESLHEPLEWEAPGANPPPPGTMDGLILAAGPADRMESGSLYFAAAIAAARSRIWIASPYCVPENDIMSALKLAALRGVDVRILTPQEADHRIPWLAALAYFDELEEAGVQIWRYTEGFMHQKVVLVDRAIASVGTINLDSRSCRLNFEATAMLFDESAADAVEAMLLADFARAQRLPKRLKERSLVQRHGAPVARLFAPLI